MDPYMRCIAGPTTMVSTGLGFPDGDPRKSLVVDFKQTFTITPQSGSIRFALVSSPLGSFALNTGTVTSSFNVPQYAGTSNLTYAWTAVNPSMPFSNSWLVIPFAENASYLIDGPTMGAYQIGSYRGLMYTADTYFTGATMANGGTVKVSRFNVSSSKGVPSAYNTVTTDNVDYTNLNAALSAATPGRYVGPAREGLNLRGVSPKPTYVDTFTTTRGFEICPYGLNSTGNYISDMVWCGLDETVPVTVVEYTGLDTTASITIELRSCLELMPRPGSMTAFAKSSPPADLSIWQKVANFARSIPVATALTVAGKTALAYAGGGASAALAAMATSLS